jgi:hypothetical protein
MSGPVIDKGNGILSLGRIDSPPENNSVPFKHRATENCNCECCITKRRCMTLFKSLYQLGPCGPNCCRWKKNMGR